jgi:LynF/TruF/PatF family peptide O-prenyltransferase
MTTITADELAMPISTFQESLIREQKLHFINAHRQAFEVKSLYPLEIFQDFVAKNNGVSLIESSCKIEADKLLAGRFLVFNPKPNKRKLAESIAFFHQVENRVDVQINYELLYKFIGNYFDFSKVNIITTGIDLRENLADSSLKIHFQFLDVYPEKIESALALSGNTFASLHGIALQTITLIGFDFYLDGRSEIELYCELRGDQLQQPDIQAFLKQTFPPSVLRPLKASSKFDIGLSKANADPVLYYLLKNKKDLLSYFSINDTAKRVHSFYQHQETINFMWAAVTQRELEKNRIDNIRLYYYKYFDWQ